MSDLKCLFGSLNSKSFIFYCVRVIQCKDNHPLLSQEKTATYIYLCIHTSRTNLVTFLNKIPINLNLKKNSLHWLSLHLNQNEF